MTVLTSSCNRPADLGFGAGSAATIVPETDAPAGITTRPDASLTSSLTVAVNPSPALADRVEIVSVALRVSFVPAARLSVLGAAKEAAGVAGFVGGLLAGRSGAGRAGCGAGAGTSRIAAVLSAGASVRFRAVESAD